MNTNFEQVMGKVKPLIAPLIDSTVTLKKTGLEPQTILTALMNKAAADYDALSENDRREFFCFIMAFLAGHLVLEREREMENKLRMQLLEKFLPGFKDAAIMHKLGLCDCDKDDNGEHKKRGDN